MTLLVYIPAIQGGFVWDDDNHVTNNPGLKSLGGLAEIWLDPLSGRHQYYPVVFTSFWVEYQLWGPRPAGYHVVNVLLHGLSAVLLWLLLRRLKVPGGWLAAMIFALHPVQVESVAWITERKNVLSGLFYLSSALCLLRFYDFHSEEEKQSRQWFYYGLGFLLFVCALLSKTVACSLPAAMILVLWWKNGRVRWREVLELLPFFLLGLFMGLLTAWLERHHIGALGTEWQLSSLERCLVAGRALWFYAGKLVWPSELIFTYPRWQIDATVWWQYVYPLGVLLLLGVLWAFRKRVGRGALVGVLFFCGTLFPALGFFDVYPFRYSYVADHFQYLASIGLITLAVGSATRAASRLPAGLKRIVVTLGVLLLVPLAVQTWRQGYIYENLETLWKDTLKKNPSSWHRHYDLATLLDREGRLEEAASHFSEALRLNPAYADAYNNLGNTLAKQGKIREATNYHYKALLIIPDHPEAHYNLGMLLAAQGRHEEAINQISEHVRIKPLHADAHYNLGTLLAMQGRSEEAMSHFSVTLRIDPNYAEAHHNLGILRAKQGRFEEAISHFSEVLRISPGHASARHNLEVTLQLMGKSPRKSRTGAKP
jgi:tetratricopeptide (TPR) repeat protein